MFYIASDEEIKQGKVTDVYFQRTKEILEAKGIEKRVKVEFIVKSFPHNWDWGVVSGIEECVELLQGLDINVASMDEGTIFKAYQPVMTIEGQYTHFGIYETSLLGFLCQASGVTTKAARCRKAAQNRPVMSFGARRMHPSISPMIERNAFIGGCDGVASIKSAQVLGVEPMGTIPHALVLLMGDTTLATLSFHEVIHSDIRRIALVDTLGDEKFEAVNVAKALGENLYAVRLDTPASRRGNFLEILKEVRWELDLRGYNSVKIFVSGGIDEDEIMRLNPVVDAYGVGASISNAPILDFAMDIVEIEGQPMAKRGKASGAKSVVRCPNCYTMEVGKISTSPRICGCGGNYEELLRPLIANGKLARSLLSHQDIRRYVLRQLEHYYLCCE